jgi:hypothetical protein
MKKKGRLQVGMDADITVFDPTTVEDSAPYEQPNQTSVGVKYLLIKGAFVTTSCLTGLWRTWYILCSKSSVCVKLFDAHPVRIIPHELNRGPAHD